MPSNLLGSHSPPSEVVLKEGEMRIWSECFFCNIGRILEYMLKEKGLCLRKLCSYILLFRNIVDFWVYVEVESLLSLCEQADLALCELMWNILAVIESH